MTHFSKTLKALSLATVLAAAATPSHAVVQAMYTAASGADSMSTSVNTNADNVANVNTVGFKSHKANIASNFYYDIVSAGSIKTENGTSAPTGVSIGTGSHVQSVYRNNTQGSHDNTGMDLNMAVSGRGYFVILGAGDNGLEAYTRDGSFDLNENGDLVNSQGHLVSPGINIPLEAIDRKVGQDGMVSYLAAGQDIYTEAGQVQLANFMNENGLKEMGNNLLTVTQASGPANLGVPKSLGYGLIRGASLENSNVSLVTEMTSLIKNQRAFQANMRVLNIADTMLESVIR